MTTGDVNDAIGRVDRAWQLEYQETEDAFRYRVVDAAYEPTLAAVRRTFIDLGMPVQTASLERGVITAENVGPTPLTREEWSAITQAEEARVKEVGSWALTLSQDPQHYIVTIKATVRLAKGKTFVLLDYALDSPKLRRQGFQPSRHAPPKAVQIASLKFWTQLEKRLAEVKAPAPRRRSKAEMDA